MELKILSRREFLQLGLIAGVTGLAGCGEVVSSPTFMAAPETIPKSLLKILPKPWRFKSLEVNSGSGPSKLVIDPITDLIAIGDGWIHELSEEVLQPIGAEQIFSRLGNQADNFLNGFGSDFARRILPIGVSPWVMLYRNGKDWLPRSQESWTPLLDPELTGRVVLPESSRVVISLAEHIDEPDALRRLRSQALTFDDRNSLNWLLSGKALVVILPLYRCFRSLSRDPRLSVAIPQSGSPLHWTVLVRPITARESFPQGWLQEAWRMPLLGRLLSKGWMPPLPHPELLQSTDHIPDAFKPILFPGKLFWEQSWSFPSLTISERNRLESLWRNSTP